ncbi:hypothetical protein [Microcoleus sp. N9_A1]|uniref:hypothetical protein n=1 Tax=Microcoleus sp. N9_A1 TaxID=3055380 RepID=UPI002FD57A98
MSEIHINPMSLFPYDVNRREGTYFERNGKRVEVEDDILKNHYCVSYEGKEFALSTWSRKQSKGLINIATFFEGKTAQEKRQILWNQFETRTINRRIIRFCERVRNEPLFLWYVSSYDLPTAQFIKKFLEWYWSEYPIINS